MKGYNVLFVGNVPWELSRGAVSELFEDFHPKFVRMFDKPGARNHKGFAHVHFADEAAVDKCASAECSDLLCDVGWAIEGIADVYSRMSRELGLIHSRSGYSATVVGCLFVTQLPVVQVLCHVCLAYKFRTVHQVDSRAPLCICANCETCRAKLRIEVPCK